jgi:hypothetical protein
MKRNLEKLGAKLQIKKNTSLNRMGTKTKICNYHNPLLIGATEIIFHSKVKPYKCHLNQSISLITSAFHISLKLFLNQCQVNS